MSNRFRSRESRRRVGVSLGSSQSIRAGYFDFGYGLKLGPPRPDPDACFVCGHKALYRALTNERPDPATQRVQIGACSKHRAQLPKDYQQ